MASAKQTISTKTKTTKISMKKPSTSKSKCNGSCPVHCKK